MDENKKNEKIQIYSYAKVWTLEHSIYSLGNVILPVPIHPYNLLYFALSLAVVMMLCNVLPMLNLFPLIFRYIGFPYAITVFLRKKKLDGKSPIKYFIAYLKYQLMERGRYFERFKGFPDRAVTCKLEWICSMRYHRR